MLDLIAEKLEGAIRYERYVVALCPFHKETRPSFFIYPDMYYCASCRAHGRTKDLLNKLSNLPQRFVYHGQQRSDNPFSRWIRHWGLPKTIELGSRNIQKTPSSYLERRGISRNCQSILRIGILDGYITFPIYNHWQELIGAVARVGEDNTSTSKYYIPKGQDPNLLYVPSWERIKEQDTVYVTFGIIDAISVYILGKASVSTTTGQRIDPRAFDSIRKRLIFIPDQGEEASAAKIITHLDWRGQLKVLDYPPGAKDPNDLFKLNREGLLSAL